MDEREELLLALYRLPADIRTWLRAAIGLRAHRIAPFSYANDLTVCPIVAAAQEAGVWMGDHVAPGHAAWGTPEGPSLEVEDFAAWFDLACEHHGVASTIELLQRELGVVQRLARVA